MNFDKKYLVSDLLKAKCGATIRVELIDRTTGAVVEDDLPDVRLEVGPPRTDSSTPQRPGTVCSASTFQGAGGRAAGVPGGGRIIGAGAFSIAQPV